MQILPTSTIANLRRTVRRKCMPILGLKGLKISNKPSLLPLADQYRKKRL